MHQKSIKCHQCVLASVCLPVALSNSDLQSLELSITKQQTFLKGSVLVRIGSTLTDLFVVRSGAFKSLQFNEDGEQKILDFFLPGEIIGLDCLADSRFHYDLVALENSTICQISREKLFSIAHHSYTLQTHMFYIMSRCINDQQQFNGSISAEERLSLFLLIIFTRQKSKGSTNNSLHLPMSRKDIGCFVGLAPETVTRLFKKMEKDKVLSLVNRTLTILDEDKLHKLTRCI